MAKKNEKTLDLAHFREEEPTNSDFSTDVKKVSRDDINLKIYNELQPESGLVIVKPPKVPQLSDSVICYDRAVEFANKVYLTPGLINYGYVSGNFIFGDFLEALFVTRNIHTKYLLVATLAMSYENVDSLANLLKGGYVDKLDLVYSDFQFSHEREGVVPYIYEKLGPYDFNLTVAGHHCKLATFTTDCGLHIGIRGSANLRSASCLEQITVQESEVLNTIDAVVMGEVIKTFQTINKGQTYKALRHKNLWKVVEQILTNLKR